MKVGLIVESVSPDEWEAWLAANHATAPEAWVRLARKGSGAVTVTRDEPSRSRSAMSKTNRAAADRLIAAGRMQPAGRAAIDAAKKDGRWADDP